jgi:hypothetical protein
VEKENLSSFLLMEETNLENSRLENFENCWFFWFENS